MMRIKTRRIIALSTAMILLICPIALIPKERATEHKTTLSSINTSETEYPYPESYMKEHKVQLDKDIGDRYVQDINVSSTLLYQQIRYEGTNGLNIKIRGDQATLKYFDHSTDKEIMHVVVNKKDKYDLAWNQTVTIKLSGDNVEVKARRGDSNHHINTLIERYDSNKYGVWDGVSLHLKSYPDPTSKEVTSNEGLTYPTSGKYKRVIQVKEWEKLSDELVYKDGLSDEFKVYLFISELIKNYAYDNWGYGERPQKSQKGNEDPWENPNYFMINTKTGVCFDFTNALVIMCRHQGIPATSLDDYHMNHTIAMVYMNNRWVPIDVTDALVYRCEYQDTDKNRWTKHKASITNAYSPVRFADFGLYYNTQIWQGN